MTIDQVKMEFAILQAMSKKLVELSEEQRGRVLNALLKMVCGEESNYQQEIRVLSFCVAKIEKMGKDQASKNIRFMVDSFYAPRQELVGGEKDEDAAEFVDDEKSSTDEKDVAQW